MESRKPCRKELLDWINVVSFAADDAKLFLDTHPGDTQALEFFEEFQRQRTQALQEYAKCYGPLTLDSASCQSDCWRWIEEPWPWQKGGC